MTLRNRQYSIFEACYWQISTPDYEYMDGAYIELIVTNVTAADLFLYTGTDRRNLTVFIDDDDQATAGTPFRIPISE